MGLGISSNGPLKKNRLIPAMPQRMIRRRVISSLLTLRVPMHESATNKMQNSLVYKGEVKRPEVRWNPCKMRSRIPNVHPALSIQR